MLIDPQHEGAGKATTPQVTRDHSPKVGQCPAKSEPVECCLPILRAASSCQELAGTNLNQRCPRTFHLDRLFHSPRLYPPSHASLAIPARVERCTHIPALEVFVSPAIAGCPDSNIRTGKCCQENKYPPPPHLLATLALPAVPKPANRAAQKRNVSHLNSMRFASI